MKLLLITAIVAMATFSLNAAEVAGTWKGSMETQMGTTEVTIALQPGADLVGKVHIGEYEAPIEKGRLESSEIDFEITIGPGKMTFQGTVSGDQMKFNVTGTQGDKYSLACKRQK